ncbi:uncharacterized protein si:ch73-103b9.2 [Brienomyrus brachyistius]|uniref:uncharacterized protein si:ch73-103b9.2 n=1 Tax=Brienomyrus brachyistius TaxID=42636 RepID=UPI0020B3DB2D|nr:uncharacterized protein si:ch73-103b9.2 [Brienomyrus brachyistius]
MPKASLKSKTFKKSASASAENNGQKPLIEKCGCSVEYCQGPGREHVAALLDISDERSALESGPYDSPAESGWDEAVTGWHRYPPLACFSHALKGKNYTGGETGYHCLLCAKIKPTKLPESKENCPRNPILSDGHQTHNDPSSTERSSMSADQPRGRGEHKSHENAAGIVRLGRKTPEDRQRHIHGPVLAKSGCITSIIDILPPGVTAGNRTIPPILKKTQNAIGGVTREDRSHCTNVAKKAATGKRRGNMVPSAPIENAAAGISHGCLARDLPATFSNRIPKKGDAPFSPYVAALPPISCPSEKQQKNRTTSAVQ